MDGPLALERPWRVSSGSAAVLGLLALRMDVVPTTAYLMLGERCSRNCGFCTQARESLAHEAALSRVNWPQFPGQAVASALSRAYGDGRIVRTCFQVTVCRGYLDEAEHAVQQVRECANMPVCVSVAPRSPDDAARLLAAGAERVTIALDAACESVYGQTKGGVWAHALGLLESCAQRFPGRIGTHLIVGLGETEREMVALLNQLFRQGVTVGLFAFTPVKGTTMAGRCPPDVGHYRRIQLAYWLLSHGLVAAEQFAYDNVTGRLLSFGLPQAQLRALVGRGDAFRTSGCPGCNRPYYNERPGGVMYNYPRPLSAEEAKQELEAVLAELEVPEVRRQP